MNNIINTQLRTLARNKSLVLSFVRSAGAWNKDWKPGPYPKTQAEREAAAKKYGLHIKDYKPYPDDGNGWGDYPMFDPMPFDGKDPFEHYDYPEHRRNFGELLHPDFEVYSGDRYTYEPRPSKAMWQRVAFFVGIVTFLYSLMLFTEDYKFIKPVMDVKTQYPTSGKTHYTFDPPEK